jgi:hypothetical protein
MTHKQALTEIDAWLAKWNPCKTKLVDGKFWCMSKTHGHKGCCRGCKALGPKGCTLQFPLGCKFWLCEDAWHDLPDEAKKELWELFKEGRLQAILSR